MPNKTLIIIALVAALLIAGLGIINYQQKTTTSPAEAEESSLSASPSPITSKNTLPMQDSQLKTLADFAPNQAQQATLVTTKGNITIKLFRDQAPLTTANFLDLAASGFYDGIVFHRVIPDFMAQVGDPLTKDESQQAMWGTGGPGYKIADEFTPELKHDKPGIVSMANTGQPNTGGSQFFITYEATPWLDGKHAVFGEVTQGLDVLNQIEVGDKITKIELQ